MLDFHPLGHVSPFALILCSSAIRQLITPMDARHVVVAGHQGKSYLAHMGFFEASGLDVGVTATRTQGNSRHIPITEIDCLEIYRQHHAGNVPIGQIMEERSQQIAAVLTQQVGGDLYETVAYSVREMLRNALEHSQTHTLKLCAQYWPQYDRVEVGILDHGRGIRASLERNPFLCCSDDRKALNYALLPGVSGTAFKGSKRRRNDVWQNSGYGLYMTSRICRMGGQFLIGSGNAAMSLDSQGKDYMPFHFSGTCVGLTIRPSRTGNLSSALKKFSEEGKEIAERLAGVVVQPSRASQMLTVDFHEGVSKL